MKKEIETKTKNTTWSWPPSDEDRMPTEPFTHKLHSFPRLAMYTLRKNVSFSKLEFFHLWNKRVLSDIFGPFYDIILKN